MVSALKKPSWLNNYTGSATKSTVPDQITVLGNGGKQTRQPNSGFGIVPEMPSITPKPVKSSLTAPSVSSIPEMPALSKATSTKLQGTTGGDLNLPVFSAPKTSATPTPTPATTTAPEMPSLSIQTTNTAKDRLIAARNAGFESWNDAQSAQQAGQDASTYYANKANKNALLTARSAGFESVSDAQSAQQAGQDASTYYAAQKGFNSAADMEDAKAKNLLNDSSTYYTNKANKNALLTARSAGFESVSDAQEAQGVGLNASQYYAAMTSTDPQTAQAIKALAAARGVRALSYSEVQDLKSLSPAQLEQKMIDAGVPGYTGKTTTEQANAAGTATGNTSTTPAGMEMYNRYYNYAAQKQAAENAASDMALGMKLANNPNLTQGAKNTMQQEQAIAHGAARSNLAGDAAQQAISYQQNQDQNALNALLSAGDLNGYAKKFADVYGQQIDTSTLSSVANQELLSSAMNSLNAYVKQYGTNLAAGDASAREGAYAILQNLWKEQGKTGKMSTEWADGILETTLNSMNPIYQAMNSYSLEDAKKLWGAEYFDLNSDKVLVDPKNPTVKGYAAFKNMLMRDIINGFISYDPATKSFEMNGESVDALMSMMFGVEPTATLASGTDTTGNAVSYSTLEPGKTFTVDDTTWTVGSNKLSDGRYVVMSNSGQMATVDSKGAINIYTTSNDSGLQTIGGKTYNNGNAVKVSLGGTKYDISGNEQEGYTATIDGQTVAVDLTNPDSPTISGTIVTGNKVYYNGKEMKTGGDTGGVLRLSDTAKDDLQTNGFTFATNNDITYKVSNDGNVIKYDATAFAQEVNSLKDNPEALNTAISAALKTSSANDVWMFYKYAVGTKVDNAVLNAVLEAGSDDAFDYAKSQMKNGTINKQTVPGLSSYLSNNTDKDYGAHSIAKDFGISIRFSGGLYGKPSAGSIIKIGDNYYYVKDNANRKRRDAGGKYWYYYRTLISLDDGREFFTLFKN